MIVRGNDNRMLSRVADSLYWMSRYLERAQHTARLLDVTLDLLPEQSLDSAAQSWKKLFASLGMELPAGGGQAFSYMQRLAFDTENLSSIAASMVAARENARQVREEISSEMWEQINRLYLDIVGADPHAIWETQPHAFFQAVKQGTHLFQGICDSTMSRGQGWHFIQVGQYLERAGNVARLLDIHLRYLDFKTLGSSMDSKQNAVGLLRSCTAWEAYCKVYTADVQVPSIAEFLLLNSEFPHAIHFSVKMVRNALIFIAEEVEQQKSSPVLRAAGRLKAMLDYVVIEEIIAQDLHKFLLEIKEQCMMIHNILQQHYIAYPVEEKIML